MIERVKQFIKKEIVLSVAFILAVLSSFYVGIDKEYIDYIDFKVLALLFCLMLVVEGLRRLKILDRIAEMFIKKSNTTTMLTMILILLCFFSSMLITNDVALITFVPLGIIMQKKAGCEKNMVNTVILQTVAANLGSMLTPIGNPQNLFIYTKYNMTPDRFLDIMSPYTIMALGLLLMSAIIMVKKEPIYKITIDESQKNSNAGSSSSKILPVFYLVLFVLSILTVLRIIHFAVPVVVGVLGCLLLDRQTLKRADYNLLLTFVCFFVFIGNVSRMDAVSDMLKNAIEGNEIIMAFVSSQFISNVPAAILLSGFTENFKELLIGVNIGGLGTIIASLASLISYKFIVKENISPKEYIIKFSIVNIIFAAIMLLKGIFI